MAFVGSNGVCTGIATYIDFVRKKKVSNDVEWGDCATLDYFSDEEKWVP